MIIEIKAGAGGEESGLFAGDLMRMYLRFFERQGWAVETLEMVPTDLGGIKDSSIAVRTKGTPDGGNGVWSRMKFEGGVHRVQRVPVTESQGRRRRRSGSGFAFAGPRVPPSYILRESDRIMEALSEQMLR